MFQSFNPYTNKVFKNYTLTSKKDLDDILLMSNTSFSKWKEVSLQVRCSQIKKIGELLKLNKHEAACLISQEVGKPITQSRAEIDKCVALCEFYSQNAETYLTTKVIPTIFESYVCYDPLGVILGIMPWNFPFWQVFRFAIPTLLAGNTVIVKHAPNVPQCALFIAHLIAKAIKTKNVYQNIFLDNETTQALVGNSTIKGVSLTGSTKAGKAVASQAGRHLKPVILELGGSNALLVCKDADLDKAVIACINGRFKNNGQSCIAVKRLLLEKSIEKVFIEKLINELDKLPIGDPLAESTFISVLAHQKFVEDLDEKLKESLTQGAQLIYGGNSKEAYFQPTLVTNVTAKMPLFTEETFGPVLPITTFDTVDEAIELANATEYGLGVSIFTKDLKKAKSLCNQFNDGAVFINDFVKSMPKLPFGGTKTSGLGRELSEEGIKAFTNTKTIVIK